MCFSAIWFVELVVLVIVIVAAIKIGNVIWSAVLEWLGGMGKYAAMIVAILKIILVALILIWLVWFAYGAIMCLLGGGGSMPPLPRIGR